VLLDDLPPTFLRVFALLFGLLWGSFLNVVIYRVPRGMSVVRPASHCPACKAPVKPWHNVPVVSFLVLRGRAGCCKAPLSLRYPLVEVIGGVLSLAIFEVLVRRLDASTPLWHAGAVYLANFALALGLVATAFIDLEYMHVPDAITYGGAVLGVATSSFRSMTFLDALLGAAVGFLVIWGIGAGWAKIRGLSGSAFGLGDAKLLMLAGAWFGWRGALFVLGAGALQGSVISIALLGLKGRIELPEAVQREREEAERELEGLTGEERAAAEKEIAEDLALQEAGPGWGKIRIAFGPFLILGTLECLFAWREMFEAIRAWMFVE
jgi:leader peptidase (prepilin peptidase) / N-methyltransferase